MPATKQQVEREHYLEFLQQHHSKILVYGHKGTGKHHLLESFAAKKSFSQVMWARLDSLSMSPENFALEFSGLFLQKTNLTNIWITSAEEASKILDTLPEGIKKHMQAILSELEKIKPDQQALIKHAFEISTLAVKKNTLVVMDSFERFLELNNFSQIKDVFSIVDFSKLGYSLAALTAVDQVVIPHLSGFDMLRVDSFTEKETIALCKQYGCSQPKEIHTLTGGHPHTLSLVLPCVSQEKDPALAAVKLLGNATHPVSMMLESSLTQALSKARGGALLHTILQVMSDHDELRLSDIARMIYHSAPVTKSLLARLLEVSLVERKANMYRVANKALANWISLKRKEVGA